MALFHIDSCTSGFSSDVQAALPEAEDTASTGHSENHISFCPVSATASAINSERNGGEMKNWHFQRNGTKHGPFTADELRQKAANGEVRPTDLVWREGMTQPVEARFVPTLFSSSSATESSRD